MLSRSGRPLAQVLFGPIAKGLVKIGVTANQVTVTGTVLSCAAVLACFPTNRLLLGTILTTILVIFDNLDGQMARMTGTSSQWGAFLDSTMDRFTDGAIFAALALWGYLHGDDAMRIWIITGALAALVFGSVVPYARARAEGVGFKADIGLAERADRLVATLVLVIAVGFGAPHIVMAVGLWLIAAASLFTVGQRMAYVYKQMKRADQA